MRRTINPQKDDNVNNNLCKAVLDDNINHIKEALVQGANINSEFFGLDPRNPFVGFSPLMMAVYLGHFSSVKLLLENHADVNLKTSSYVASPQTALDMAIDGILNTIKRVENDDFLTYKNIAVTLIESKAFTSNKKNMLILQRLGLDLTVSHTLEEELKNTPISDPVEEKMQNYSTVTLQKPIMNGLIASEPVPPKEPDQSKELFTEFTEISTTSVTGSQMGSGHSSDKLSHLHSTTGSSAVDLSSFDSTHLKIKTPTQTPASIQDTKLLPMSSAYLNYGLCHHSNGRNLTVRPAVNSNSRDTGFSAD